MSGRGRWFLVLLGLAVAGLAGPLRAQETSPLGYVEMPLAEDGAWVLASPPGSGRNWARPEFVRHLMLVAREWKRRHPEGPFLRIGDLSKPDGSEFPPHKTHRDGLTADIFTTPRNVCHVSFDDQQLTLELARLFHDLGARQILYNGDLVDREVPVAQPWPQHDDHFHVVIDPARVPAEGDLLVLPGPGLRAGSSVGAPRLAEDRSGLELSWQVVGEAPLRHVRVVFDDEGDDGPPVHDTGAIRPREPLYRLPIPLEHGRTYRWRLEVTTLAGPSFGFGWQTLRVDLEPPRVEALSPRDEAEVDAAPELRWRYEKAGAAQLEYALELDQDADHRRGVVTLGPFRGAAARHLLDVPLRPRRRYHWRVRVTDVHGNAATSEWTSFRTTSRYGRGQAADEAPARRGKVTANSLNLRSGPGTGHPIVCALARGAEVRILGEEPNGWLRVEALGPDGQRVAGFVSGDYVEEAD